MRRREETEEREGGERKKREESRVDYSICYIICDELWGERVSEYPGKKEVRSNEVIGSKLPGLSGLSRLSGVVLLLYCCIVGLV